MAEIAASSALQVLLHEVIPFLNQKINLKKHVKEEVETFQICLERIQAYLKDKGDDEGNEQHKIHVKQMRDVAYDIQDVLDELMLHEPRKSYSLRLHQKAYEVAHDVKHRFPLSEIFSKIKNINNRIQKMASLASLVNYSNSHGLQEGPSQSGSSAPAHILDDDEEMIGFDKYEKQLMEQLMNGASELKTIAVVGPVGSGKSALVKKVFGSNSVRGHFDCLAWVYVSRIFNDEIFQQILQFCVSGGEPIPDGRGTDASAKLKSYLHQKRYLIVLDDVWEKDHQERIKNALPDNLCGSRIIITTRHSNVSDSCDFSCRLSRLRWPEAWKLFCEHAFQNRDGSCPPELKDCSEKILRRCDGSPLAIVTLSGLLSKKPKFLSDWEKFYVGLGSEIASNSDLSIINKSLSQSYKDLPSNLKKCFLYFSIFPANYAVKQGRLIRLWAAEGFVNQDGGRTKEEEAESCLNELISRNLVLVNARGIDKKVRRCRVTNLMLEYILRKSNEEDYTAIVPGPHGSSGEKIRRISIHKWDSTALSRYNDLGSVRSMILIRSVNLSPEIDDILGKFKLLSTLDLEGAQIEELPKYISNLTLLRYLSLRRTRIKSVPKCIKRLSKLETLDLKQTKVTKIPKQIWQLHNLRHLFVYHYNIKDSERFDSVQGVQVFEGVRALINLQKLTLVKPDKKCRVIKELEYLVQLKKLGLISITREVGKDLCASIQKMDQLITLDLCSISKEECLDLNHLKNPPGRLQRLYLKGRLEKVPDWICSLQNLRKIRLKWSRLQDNPLVVLQDLPHLLELVMVNSYTGDMLEFETGRFRELKILRIEAFPWLHSVYIHKGSMPKLQKLTLFACQELKTLPWGINYLTRVEELLLYDMHRDFIAQLNKSSKDRWMVRHIPVIRSFEFSDQTNWTEQNLS